MGPQEVAKTFRATEAGAVAALEKPRGIGHANYEDTARELVQTVKAMSEVRVVRRWKRHREAKAASAVPGKVRHKKVPAAEVKVVAIGASTGGPPVLQTILSGLSGSFPVPVLIVQHIAAGFLQGLASWLSGTTGFPVHVAAHAEKLLPGRICLAPDDFQMGVEGRHRIALSKGDSENGLRPAVSCLFRSVAESYGKNGVGVLLTGMGKDGAKELKLMKEKGAITIAQDEESSVIHGMPGEAIKLGAAIHVLPADEIAATLEGLVVRI